MLKFEWLVANAPRKLNRVSFSGACGSNQYESLSGTETAPLAVSGSPSRDNVPINMNPYQGLKPIIIGYPVGSEKVPINMNPYQGLKLA